MENETELKLNIGDLQKNYQQGYEEGFSRGMSIAFETVTNLLEKHLPSKENDRKKNIRQLTLKEAFKLKVWLKNWKYHLEKEWFIYLLNICT